MIKRLIVIVSIVGLFSSLGASEPRSRKWFRRRRRHKPKPPPQRPVKTPQESFRDAVARQSKRVEEALIESAHIIGKAIGPIASRDEIANKVKALDQASKKQAYDSVQQFIAAVLEIYHPEKLKADYRFEEEEDVIKNARDLHKRIKEILQNFEDEVINILQDPRMTNVEIVDEIKN